MLPSGEPDGEHKSSSGCNGNGAQYSYQDHGFPAFNAATNSRIMPSSHSSGSAFSFGALDAQDNDLRQPQLASQNHCLLRSETMSSNSALRSRDVGENDFENFQQGFPFSDGQGFNSTYGAQDFFEVFAKSAIPEPSARSDISPEALLTTLSVIQQKTQQLQAVVQLMSQGGGRPTMPQQQQALAAGIASVISQLVLASAGLLQQSSAPLDHVLASNPQLSSIFPGALTSGTTHIFQQNGMGNSLDAALGDPMESAVQSFCAPDRGCSRIVGMGTDSSTRSNIGGSEIGKPGFRDRDRGGQTLGSSTGNPGSSLLPRIGNIANNTHDVDVAARGTSGNAVGVNSSHFMDTVANQLLHHVTGASLPPTGDQDPSLGWRDDDDGEPENLPPGSYDLVEMDAAEILAEHTHFCEICGKGFKRDANLRMHMRGHGDEYKTPAALARPDKSIHDPSTIRPRRYSCPFVGCKRNKKHRKFQPLKTMLCVKNHYRRSHCPKVLMCQKCKTKKFSVVADLKTHEKHCGRDKWQCSCGTTFSRKDKLFGHIGLFTGHTPALPLHEMEVSLGALDPTSSCFSSGNGKHSESLAGKESALLGAGGSKNFLHRNVPAMNTAFMAASGQIDMDDESALCVQASRTEGLQAVRQRGSCPSISEDSSGGLLEDDPSPPPLGSSSVSDSSMLHGLLSSGFLNHADGN